MSSITFNLAAATTYDYVEIEERKVVNILFMCAQHVDYRSPLENGRGLFVERDDFHVGRGVGHDTVYPSRVEDDAPREMTDVRNTGLYEMTDVRSTPSLPSVYQEGNSAGAGAGAGAGTGAGAGAGVYVGGTAGRDTGDGADDVDETDLHNIWSLPERPEYNRAGVVDALRTRYKGHQDEVSTGNTEIFSKILGIMLDKEKPSDSEYTKLTGLMPNEIYNAVFGGEKPRKTFNEIIECIHTGYDDQTLTEIVSFISKPSVETLPSGDYASVDESLSAYRVLQCVYSGLDNMFASRIKQVDLIKMNLPIVRIHSTIRKDAQFFRDLYYQKIPHNSLESQWNDVKKYTRLKEYQQQSHLPTPLNMNYILSSDVLYVPKRDHINYDTKLRTVFVNTDANRVYKKEEWSEKMKELWKLIIQSAVYGFGIEDEILIETPLIWSDKINAGINGEYGVLENSYIYNIIKTVAKELAPSLTCKSVSISIRGLSNQDTRDMSNDKIKFSNAQWTNIWVKAKTNNNRVTSGGRVLVVVRELPVDIWIGGAMEGTDSYTQFSNGHTFMLKNMSFFINATMLMGPLKNIQVITEDDGT